MLEQTVSDLWKCINALYAKHGQNSPRWAQRRDMALYYENRRKALNVTPNGASITMGANPYRDRVRSVTQKEKQTEETYALSSIAVVAPCVTIATVKPHCAALVPQTPTLRQPSAGARKCAGVSTRYRFAGPVAFYDSDSRPRNFLDHRQRRKLRLQDEPVFQVLSKFAIEFVDAHN
jgi:hypothetical protein